MKKNKKEAIEAMIAQNNRLRQKLTAENETFYTDLLVYIRTRGWLFDEERIESQLLQILQDVLEAQEQGLTASDYFGDQPHLMAQDLLEEMPKPTLSDLGRMGSYIFAISSLFTLMIQWSKPTNTLSLGPLVLNGLMAMVLVSLTMFLLQQSIYNRLLQNKWLAMLVVGLLLGGTVVAWGSIQAFLPDFLSVEVPLNGMRVLLCGALVGFVAYLWLNRSNLDVVIYAASPFVLLSLGHALAIRSSFYQALAMQPSIHLVIVIGLALAMAWFYWQAMKAGNR